MKPPSHNERIDKRSQIVSADFVDAHLCRRMLVHLTRQQSRRAVACVNTGVKSANRVCIESWNSRQTDKIGLRCTHNSKLVPPQQQARDRPEQTSSRLQPVEANWAMSVDTANVFCGILQNECRGNILLIVVHAFCCVLSTFSSQHC